MIPKIFISYAHEDIRIARELELEFSSRGWDFFRDERKIKPGDEWIRIIEENLVNCSIFVLLWSKHASLSVWVDRERQGAIKLNKKIMTLWLDDTPLPLLTGIYQAIKNESSLSASFNKLIKGIDAIYDFPEMVKITGGMLLMGAGINDFQIIPHQVDIRDFFISKSVITQKQYLCSKEDYTPQVKVDDPKHPATWVSWHDAHRYCEWLSQKERKKYRLPTEAEWEYACRAGSQGKYSMNVNEYNLHEYAWYNQNSEGLCDIGRKKPNLFGLYDMHGLVWEWCSSLFLDYPYHPNDGREDLSTNGNRVIRGGSYFSNATELVCAYRRKNLGPNALQTDLGFRVVWPEPTNT